MKVLILGPGKSGTTALFYQIASAMPKNTKKNFEPKSRNELDKSFNSENSVTKALVEEWSPKMQERIEGFDKVVFTTRHPFDMLISCLLYRVYDVPDEYLKDEKTRERWFDLLDAKVQGNYVVSVLSLVQRFEACFGFSPLAWISTACSRSIEVARRRMEDGKSFECGEYFPYEDFTEGRYTGLNNHLGFNIDPGADLGKHKRVLRSGSVYEYKDWFLASDYRVFGPLFREYGQSFRYNLEGPGFTSVPDNLDPKTTIDYSRKLVYDKHNL